MPSTRTTRPGAPAFNEERTIAGALDRVLSLPSPPLEVLVVDDGSTDGTTEIAAEIAARDRRVRVLRHPTNAGKGAAIRTALSHALGDLVVIQDADLENDPRDLSRMARLFAGDDTTVVYGSRWLGRRRRSLTRSRLAAFVLSWLTNRFYGSCITDEPTCYKMFRREVLEGLELTANGFDFCPEVTAKALIAGHEIREIPISYAPRSRREGKKIGVWDGIRAVGMLFLVRLTTRRLAKQNPAKRQLSSLARFAQEHTS